MIMKLAYRGMTNLSFRSTWKVLYLMVWKGFLAIRKYKKRRDKGELYPPFMFVALTNTCNLRCKGCGVEKEGDANYMDRKEVDAIVENSKKMGSHYVTLLGGEPMMYKEIWDVWKDHSDCYFQVITNGMFFKEENAKRLSELGNVTPLISVDGWEPNNDERRGQGVFKSLERGMGRLKENKVLFGIATTTTAKNMDEVLSDEYLQYFVDQGAMYIWFYVYRPVGENGYDEYCLSEEQLVEVRRRLLQLRRKHPIVIIDTYWTAEGEAFCPAAMGLGYHIGPKGSIEICPPLNFATDFVKDNDYDMVKTIQDSSFLKGFEGFVNDRTKGCVILENPQELVQYISDNGCEDVSGRDALAEINRIKPRHSHHLPGKEIPEDYWVYKLAKKNVFFGMGAAG
ncbi:MAG: radical SAM protein [Lentisphaerales bacterium]|nr:radical SAM protein [Lentisphaerales bacterium]